MDRLFPCLYAPFVRLYRRSDRGPVLPNGWRYPLQTLRVAIPSINDEHLTCCGFWVTYNALWPIWSMEIPDVFFIIRAVCKKIVAESTVIMTSDYTRTGLNSQRPCCVTHIELSNKVGLQSEFPPLFSQLSELSNYCLPVQYVTAKLWWHLPNMNVIEIITGNLGENRK